MIDRYSFLNLEELTEQRRNIKKKKVSKTMRGKMGCGGGGGVAALRESETEKRAEGKKKWESTERGK